MPQFDGEFDGLVMITRGGLIPGGILCEAMGIKSVHTAAIHLPKTDNQAMAWPTFLQFPIDALVTGHRLLVVDDIWTRGTNMVIVKSRLEAAGARVETAVLHFRPKSNLFPDSGPDYYGAITDEYIIYPWETPQQLNRYRPKPPTAGDLD
jgi:hypoxanthine phosphoribosyltransferase